MTVYAHTHASLRKRETQAVLVSSTPSSIDIAQRHAASERKRRRRASLTDEERHAQRTADAQRKRMYRERVRCSNLTPAQQAAQQVMTQERVRQHRSNLTPAQQAASRAASREGKRLHRSNLTPAQQAASRAANAARMRAQRQREAATRNIASSVLADARRIVAPPLQHIRQRTFDNDVEDAARFRTVLQELSPVHVCAVCGCRCNARDSKAHAFDTIPNVSLLSTCGEMTEELPRDALTRVEIEYGGRDGGSEFYCMTFDGKLSSPLPFQMVFAYMSCILICSILHNYKAFPIFRFTGISVPMHFTHVYLVVACMPIWRRHIMFSRSDYS